MYKNKYSFSYNEYEQKLDIDVYDIKTDKCKNVISVYPEYKNLCIDIMDDYTKFLENIKIPVGKIEFFKITEIRNRKGEFRCEIYLAEEKKFKHIFFQLIDHTKSPTKMHIVFHSTPKDPLHIESKTEF